MEQELDQEKLEEFEEIHRKLEELTQIFLLKNSNEKCHDCKGTNIYPIKETIFCYSDQISTFVVKCKDCNITYQMEGRVLTFKMYNELLEDIERNKQ